MTEKIGIIVYSDHPKSLAMAMNLGHVALSMDHEVVVYFTFDGLSHLMEGEKRIPEDFQRLLDAGVPDPYDLLADFVESGGEMTTTVACTTTIDMLGWDQEAMDEAVTSEFAGAARFLEVTADANHVFSFG